MNIVVAVDFSDLTDRVVDAAIAQATDRAAHIWIIHVVGPDPEFVGFDAGPAVVRDQVAHEIREERRAVESLAARVRAAGVPVTAHVVQGPTVETILNEAEERQADLIVMGSHHHGILHHLLVGSESEGVLRRANCPLLFVPPVEPVEPRSSAE